MSSGAGEPIPIHGRDDLIALIRSGIKPASERRIGVEHEKFGMRRQPDGSWGAVGFDDGIEPTLKALVERYGWTPDVVNDRVIGLSRAGGNVSLEPGGQLELSGAPWATLDAVAEELRTHLVEVLEVSEETGIRWLTMGAQPITPRDAIGWVPKPRYQIMRRYLPTRGSMAKDMMKRTCTVQANFDFTSEADAASIMQTILRVTPITSAIFAASPFLDGKPSGQISSRCHFWTDTDNDRAGYLRGILEPGYTFDDYVEWLLDVPMFFIERDGEWLETHQTFRAFMDEGLGEHRALESDWGLHMSTAFPEVRLKRYIEVRGCDCVPAPLMMSFAALWTGVLYDDDARARAASLTEALAYEERLALHGRMIDGGLQATLPDGTRLAELASELVSIARQGLCAQGRDSDTQWLDVLDQRVTGAGFSLAERMLDDYGDHGDLMRALAPMWLTPGQLDAEGLASTVPAFTAPSPQALTQAPVEVELDLQRPAAAPGHGAGDAHAGPDLDVLFRDEHVIAINKPAGIAVHAGVGHRERNLVALVEAWLDANEVAYEGPIAPSNRLDAEVSGVTLFPLTKAARSAFGEMFERREVRKVYWALVAGRTRAKGVINRDVPDQGKAKPARTRYRTLSTTGRVSHIKVSIETGRKHQIRRHLASIGHPILGDQRYGHTRAATSFRRRFELDRIMLHARQVSCEHPITGKRLHIVCSPDIQWDEVTEGVGITDAAPAID